MHKLDLQRFQMTAPSPEVFKHDDPPFINLTYLHPTASRSICDIVRHKLRSVLCVLRFQARVRREAGFGPPSPGSAVHVPQTLPFLTQGMAATAVRWLDADPRRDSPEAQADLRRLPLRHDFSFCATSWARMERRFGVRERAKDDPFRFYMCMTHDWRRPTEYAGVARGTSPMRPGYPLGPEWERSSLAKYIREEEEQWASACKRRSSGGETAGAGLLAQAPSPSPQQGLVADAVSTTPSERGEAAIPTPAVGMWLFPPEAIMEAKEARRGSPWAPDPEFDMSAARPGLILFEVM